MDGLLEWLGHAPKWFAPLLSILGVGGALSTWVISRRDRSHDLRRALQNEWFRVLVFEQALPPVLAFLNEQRSVFAALTMDSSRRNIPAEYDAVLKGFKVAASLLQRRLLVIEVISATVYQEVLGILDEIDDVLTVHCAANSGFSVSGHADLKDYSKVDLCVSKLTVELFEHFKALHQQTCARQTLWSRILGVVKRVRG
jgi:hypothetical protein